MRRILLLLLVMVMTAVPAAGCSGNGDGGTGPGGSAGGATPRPKVVVTTDILGDVTRNILGEVADVEVLIPNSHPPRNFKPAAADLNLLAGANLIVAIGLGLEPGLQDAITEARTKGVTVLEVGPTLNPIPVGGSEANARATADETPGSTAVGTPAAAPAPPDPRIWIDPDRMKQAMKLIGDTVVVLPGVDEKKVRDQIAAYIALIDKADEEIQATLSTIPDDRRTLMSTHDNIGYFADRYGFTIAGVIVPASRPAQDEQIQPAEVVAAAAVIVDQKVVAIVTDPDTISQTNAADVATAAATRGPMPRVVTLDVEALGAPGTGAETYLGLLTTNARTLATALTA